MEWDSEIHIVADVFFNVAVWVVDQTDHNILGPVLDLCGNGGLLSQALSG